MNANSALDAQFEYRFPHIKFREATPITVFGQGTRLGCRLCIARGGFKANQDWDTLFETRDDFDKHMREEHPLAT